MLLAGIWGARLSIVAAQVLEYLRTPKRHDKPGYGSHMQRNNARWLCSTAAQHWANKANKRWLALARSEAITSPLAEDNIPSHAHMGTRCATCKLILCNRFK